MSDKKEEVSKKHIQEQKYKFCPDLRKLYFDIGDNKKRIVYINSLPKKEQKKAKPALDAYLVYIKQEYDAKFKLNDDEVKINTNKRDMLRRIVSVYETIEEQKAIAYSRLEELIAKSNRYISLDTYRDYLLSIGGISTIEESYLQDFDTGKLSVMTEMKDNNNDIVRLLELEQQTDTQVRALTDELEQKTTMLLNESSAEFEAKKIQIRSECESKVPQHLKYLFNSLVDSEVTAKEAFSMFNIKGEKIYENIEDNMVKEPTSDPEDS